MTNRAAPLCALALLLLPGWARADSDYTAPKPPDIEWTQRIGEDLPLEAPLRTALDDRVRLDDYFGEGPVILMLGYNRCPMLCGEQIQGLLQTLQGTRPEELRGLAHILFLSVDPDEPTELTVEAQANAQQALDRTGIEADFVFLRGDAGAVQAVADAAGFAFHEDAESEQIAHPAGFLVAQSDGTISRYLFGVRYEPQDLRLAVLEAGQGKVGQVADQLLLLCFHYDPLTGKYGLAIARFIQAGALFTVLTLGGFIGWQLKKERQPHPQ